MPFSEALVETPDVLPVQVPVDYAPTAVADLMEAISRASQSGKLDGGQTERAWGFVDAMFAHGDPDEVIARLPRGDKHVALEFPRGIYG